MSGTRLAIPPASMTIVAELVLVTSSIGLSMALSRLALSQLFVLVRMDNRQQPDEARRP
jgi:hypothetical protein